jgi:hypothetical protein
MKKERAFALKAGDELFWRKRPSGEIPKKIMAGGKLIQIEFSPHEIWAQKYGESVEFIRISTVNSQKLLVKSKNEEPLLFSADYFE